MTEQEWDACEDPGRMLDYLLVRTGQRPSSTKHVEAMRIQRGATDRKLRLWVEACRERWPHLAGKTDLDDTTRLHQAVVQWADTFAAAPPGEIAHLLRDIVGNPFRQVTLFRVPDGGKVHALSREGRLMRSLGGSRYEYADCCPWLTPQVRDLARAAYELRPGQRCRHCSGQGRLLYVEVPAFDPIAALRAGPAAPDVMPRRQEERICTACHGTGFIDDGTLDPARLGVLADALEEAGCPAEEWAACPNACEIRPKISGERRVLQLAGMIFFCNTCRGGKVSRPSPLLAHLRSPGPHVRGCWAVDLCLARE